MATMLLLLLVSALSYADATTIPRVDMEGESTLQVRDLPEGWLLGQRSASSEGLELLLAVKQTNLRQLQSTLLAVSDPDSASYGAHLTNDKVHSLIAPRPSHLTSVLHWLRSHNLTAAPLSPNSDLLQVHCTVRQAEMLLQTHYFSVQHHSGASVLRCPHGYSLPSDVASALDFITPTVHLPPQRAAVQPRSSVEAPLVGNSPKHLRELYSVGSAVGSAPANSMAVTAFLGQKYSKADLHEFWKLFCGGIVCGKGDPSLAGDETTGFGAGIEAMLDIQSITGVAGNITSAFWGFSGRSPDNSQNEPFMKWLSLLSSTPDASVPKLFSTSYGEDEDAWSLAAAKRMNVEFQKAGVRGISLLFASGDEGANCKQGDKYKPETPGSSPWVTAVGGTEGSSKEEAIGLSSGGFSDRWSAPEWQQAAVQQYLKASGLPSKSKGYNISGRAYPDIAAQASDFTVVANRVPNPGVAGTSCASPTASGVIALLNDKRLAEGKPTLGFLNPWIYKNAGLWNDISSGSSDGCEGFGDGWPAKKGWDAVTGLGTPNYKQLLTAL